MNVLTILKMKPKSELIIMPKVDEIETLFKNYSDLHPNELVLFDGIVTDGDYNILFILKESNISGGNSEKGFDKSFWFKEVYNAKSTKPATYYGDNLNRVEKSAQTKYFNCITQIVEEIKKDGDIDNNKEIGVSYININKNGGGSDCDNIGIKNWLENSCKRKFLSDQIEIIDPAKIVVFSCNNANPKIQEFAEELNAKYENVINKEYHPSRYKKK